MPSKFVPALALCTVVLPAFAQVCTPFTDVPVGDPFCGDIQWMYNRGITLGCTATTYCPAQPVRRDQMAAFMNRLGNIVFQQGGNSFGAPAVLGTTDSQPLELRVSSVRAMRYESALSAPNVLGGSVANGVTPLVRGAAIAGGGTLANDPLFPGGGPNRVTDDFGTVAGGVANVAGDGAGATSDRRNATVGGGRNNTASGAISTIAGGSSHAASGRGSTVAGGLGNQSLGDLASVLGGEGNVASGDYSAVLGGRNNRAGGGSVAMGTNAGALGDGSFAFADSQPFDFDSTSVNAFRVRATGGVRFVVDVDSVGNTTFSCLLTSATAGWACASDRALKRNLVELDGREILSKLAEMPVYAWTPIGNDGTVRHFGPTAQDFQASFGLGDGTMIGMQDADGVALAAIQGLNEKVEVERAARDSEIAALRAELASLRSLLAQRTIALRP